MACTGSREGEQFSHSTLSVGCQHQTLPGESTSHLCHHWQRAKGVSTNPVCSSGHLNPTGAVRVVVRGIMFLRIPISVSGITKHGNLLSNHVGNEVGHGQRCRQMAWLIYPKVKRVFCSTASPEETVNQWFRIPNVIGFYILKDNRRVAGTDWVVSLATQCIVFLQEPSSVHWRKGEVYLWVWHIRTWWVHLQQCKKDSSLGEVCNSKVSPKALFDTADYAQTLLSWECVQYVSRPPTFSMLRTKTPVVLPESGLIHHNRGLILTIPFIVLSMYMARCVSKRLSETPCPRSKTSNTGGERSSGPDFRAGFLSLPPANSWPNVWKKSPARRRILIPSK